MKPHYHSIVSALVLCSVTSHAFGADAAKDKTIDAFTVLDAKSTKANSVVAKIVATQDPVHRKALSISIDFAVPGTMPNFQKTFPAGLIDYNKYSGIRFFAKTDVETKFSVWLSADGKPGDTRHADGSPVTFATGCSPASTWSEVILPFEKFGSIPLKEWKNGEQKIYPAGLPIPPDDYAKLNRLMFAFSINQRGTSTVGQVMIKDVALIAK